MRFETIIRGGRLIDPAAGIDDIRDVGIVGGRIAAVEPRLPDDAARVVIDATGRIVTPGLIDLHTHVFWGRDFFGVDADSIAWRSGVTTWVDAGSVGRVPAAGVPGVHRAAARRCASCAFINISYLGLAGLNYDEYCNPAACDVPLLARVAALRTATWCWASRCAWARKASAIRAWSRCAGRCEASEVTGLPVMCHISEAPPDGRGGPGAAAPGDIVTHAYTGGGERLIDDDGRLRAAARRARDRGVLFDIGHGAGSFSFALGRGARGGRLLAGYHLHRPPPGEPARAEPGRRSGAHRARARAMAARSSRS